MEKTFALIDAMNELDSRISIVYRWELDELAKDVIDDDLLERLASERSRLNNELETLGRSLRPSVEC